MQPEISLQHSTWVLSIANQSIESSYDYSHPIKEIEHFYLSLAKKTIPVLHQSRVLSNIRFEFIQLEQLCKGIQLLNEFPERTKARIENFPEKILNYLNQEKNALQQKSAQL